MSIQIHICLSIYILNVCIHIVYIIIHVPILIHACIHRYICMPEICVFLYIYTHNIYQCMSVYMPTYELIHMCMHAHM